MRSKQGKGSWGNVGQKLEELKELKWPLDSS